MVAHQNDGRTPMTDEAIEHFEFYIERLIPTLGMQQQAHELVAEVRRLQDLINEAREVLNEVLWTVDCDILCDAPIGVRHTHCAECLLPDTDGKHDPICRAGNLVARLAAEAQGA